MKEDRNFKIDIYGLKNGIHSFDFDFDEKLFENFENRLIDSGQGKCKVTIDKSETMMEIEFQISGTLQLTCDRSMDMFDHSVTLSEKLILKYGEAFDDSKDEIWVIPNTQDSINIGQILYEYLTLAVPMKKLHPRFEDTESEEGLAFVYSSDEEIEEQKEEENNTDPRWDALKNIKNLK